MGIAKVTLIERAPEFKNIGYMIGIWGNGRKILEKLGIDRSVVEKEGYEVPYTAFQNRHGKVLKAINADPEKFGNVVIIPRTALHAGIIEQMKGVDIRLGTTIKRDGKNC